MKTGVLLVYSSGTLQRRNSELTKTSFSGVRSRLPGVLRQPRPKGNAGGCCPRECS